MSMFFPVCLLPVGDELSISANHIQNCLLGSPEKFPVDCMYSLPVPRMWVENNLTIHIPRILTHAITYWSHCYLLHCLRSCHKSQNGFVDLIHAASPRRTIRFLDSRTVPEKIWCQKFRCITSGKNIAMIAGEFIPREIDQPWSRVNGHQAHQNITILDFPLWKLTIWLG